LEECVEGGNVFVAGTYRDILRRVRKDALEGEGGRVDLRLDTEVVHFEIENNHGVTITTAAGQNERFDEVVITCPLGWLKREKERVFTPRLPPRLDQAIDNINYGRLEKLYVTFPRPFWLGDAANTDSYPIFTHFHDPSYVKHPSDEGWNQNVMSMAHLPGDLAHPTLLFYVYGACGTAIVKQVEGLQEHSEQYNSILEAFARPFYSKLPHFGAEAADCKPSSFLMTQWQNDRFAGNGSYCNFQVGLEEGDIDIEVMRDAGGLTEKGLWLAGEHTAPFIALGTTTGAWWSGEGVAKRICARYGLRAPEDADGYDHAERKDPTVRSGNAANLNGLAI
jgi:hypothetical protein